MYIFNLTGQQYLHTLYKCVVQLNYACKGVSMKTITIRGIDDKLAEKIKKEAKKDNISVNKWIVSQIKKAAGMERKERFKKYHDLDHLAGTWTKDDLDEFRRHTRQFEKIDKDIWK